MGGPVVRFFVVVGEPCFSAARMCSLLRDRQPCIGSAHGLTPQGCQEYLAHPEEASYDLTALWCQTSLLVNWRCCICHSDSFRCKAI